MGRTVTTRVVIPPSPTLGGSEWVDQQGQQGTGPTGPTQFPFPSSPGSLRALGAMDVHLMVPSAVNVLSSHGAMRRCGTFGPSSPLAGRRIIHPRGFPVGCRTTAGTRVGTRVGARRADRPSRLVTEHYAIGASPLLALVFRWKLVEALRKRRTKIHGKTERHVSLSTGQSNAT